MKHRWLLAGVCCSLGVAHAGPIGYAQATGYFKKESRPTLYQPLNLLDAREATSWCTTGADPLNDQLTFGFKGSTRIDELRIYTGNGFDESTFHQFSRARKFVFRGPTGAQTFTVADQRGLQSVAVNPPLEGAQFTLEILDIFPAEDPDQPSCLTDVVFVSEGKPLNGSWLTSKLKYDKSQAPVLGTWFGGFEGAPDRFLSFYFDGTYRYAYEPIEGGTEKAKTLQGSYELSGTRMTLELPGKGKVSAQLHREVKELNGKKAVILRLEGGLPEDLKQPFREVL